MDIIQKIIEIDTWLLLCLNQFHTPTFDGLMVSLTKTLTWIPLYAFFIFLIYKKFKKNSWKILLAITIIVVLSDQISSSLCKPFFKRLRPCHELSLSGKIHNPNGCGGQFGFVSSHAANTMGVATFLVLVLDINIGLALIIFFWALLVSYTRIYLGVHYPLDIIGGWLVGSCMAFLIYRFLKWKI